MRIKKNFVRFYAPFSIKNLKLFYIDSEKIIPTETIDCFKYWAACFSDYAIYVKRVVVNKKYQLLSFLIYKNLYIDKIFHNILILGDINNLKFFCRITHLNLSFSSIESVVDMNLFSMFVKLCIIFEFTNEQKEILIKKSIINGCVKITKFLLEKGEYDLPALLNFCETKFSKKQRRMIREKIKNRTIIN